MRLLCLALLFLALPGVASAAPALDGTFDISGKPQRLALGPDGNVWFTMTDSTATDGMGNATPKEFGRITPDGTVTEFDTPDDLAAIGITAGPDNHLWMTAPGNVIRVDPGNPTAGVAFANSNIIQAQTIVTGPDDNLWTSSADKIFRTNTAGVELKHYTVSGLGARGTAAGGDGNIWVADFAGARILKAPTNSGDPDPTTKFDVGGGPQEVTAGPTGQMGFSNPTAAPQFFGRMDYAGNFQPTNFGPNTDPFGIVFGNDGAYWFGEFGANRIGRVTPSGGSTSLDMPANSGPRHLTKGADDTLWVGLENAKKIARVTGVSAPRSLPVVPTGNGNETGTGAGIVPDTIAPGVTTYALSSKVIRPFKSGASVAAKVTRGTRVTYTLTESATAAFTVQRLLPGRKVKVKKKTRCVRPTRKNAKRHRCTRIRRVGSFTRVSAPGTNSFTFTGRVNGKALKPGRYRLRLVARDAAGNASKARTLRFRVVK